MERNDGFDRRSVLRGMAGVFAAGVLAGCSGSGGGSNGGGGSGNETGTGNGGSGTTSGASNTETGGSTDAGTASAESGNESTTGGGAQVEQYLSDAQGYDGSIADMTGTDTVEIAVGTGDSGFGFDPAAVRVSTGTTVRWAWTGEGGAHNVISEDDGPLDSGPAETGSDITYEETLDQSGTYRYYCEPHRQLGMKGAVIVSG